MTTTEKLKALRPCASGLARAVECGALRGWWDLTLVRSDMVWLMGRAHVKGTLSRRRLVSVALSCVETVANLMPDDALPLVADLRAWACGADDVDLVATRDALCKVCQTAYAAASAAADASAAYDAAACVGAAAAAADASAAASAASAAAADASAAASASADASAASDASADASAASDAAMCDVIRDAITIDDVCAALGLDPDEVLS